MKTRLPREELAEALTAVAAIAGGRTTKPILGCVRITTEGEAIELSATDGEAALRLRVGSFRVEEPGEAVVPADQLHNIVRELPDAEIRLDADGRFFTVCGAGSEFKVFTLASADYPPVPSFDDEPDLVMDGRQLWRMISLTSYAAARETSRYAINGVLWEKRGKRLHLVATDGRRLARSSGAVTRSSAADFEVIVPIKALIAFERVFGHCHEQEDWTIDIKVMPNQILLRSGDRMLSTVLIEGTFPKYDEVIPRDSTRQALVNRAELVAGIRQAALLASEEARAVRLSFAADLLVITAQSAEHGEARVELPVEFKGEALQIGFNPAFFNDALKVLNVPNVRLEFQDSFRPGVISGDDLADFLYVIMPVSL